MIIKSEADLRALYGWAKGRAEKKVLNQLEKHSIHFIEKSPFLILSTYDTNGKVDASPRGGSAGFVKILDNNTLLIPDAKGNNRVDSLVNIVESGRVGTLFLIPGINETLRLNGTAQVTTNPDYIQLFSTERNPPKSCIKITVEEVFIHCAKAFMRSDLWGNTHRIERPGFPTIGKILNDQLGTKNPLETEAEMIKRYKKDL